MKAKLLEDMRARKEEEEAAQAQTEPVENQDDLEDFLDDLIWS